MKSLLRIQKTNPQPRSLDGSTADLRDAVSNEKVIGVVLQRLL